MDIYNSTDRNRSKLITSILPVADRISVLAAMVVLAYTLENYIILPESGISLQLPGFFLDVSFNIEIVIAVLVAGLVATGSSWLLRDHPVLQNSISAFPHWVLPALTALVIGLPLNQLDYGISWWVSLLVGVVLVVMVLLGEYISIDIEDERYPYASAGLTAVAYTLLLVLVSILRSEELRLFFVVPTFTISSWLVCLRTMHLRLNGEWTIYESAVVAWVVGQIAAAFHYWSLSPISYGLVLLGIVYALTSLVSGLIEEKPFRKMVWEPIIAILLSWGAAFWVF